MTLMKQLLWIGLFVLALGALPSRANACYGPVKVDAGFKLWFKVNCGNQGPLGYLAPWYTYFPYEAHFQTPAPTGLYPHWPAPVPAPAPPGTGNPQPGQPQPRP